MHRGTGERIQDGGRKTRARHSPPAAYISSFTTKAAELQSRQAAEISFSFFYHLLLLLLLLFVGRAPVLLLLLQSMIVCRQLLLLFLVANPLRNTHLLQKKQLSALCAENSLEKISRRQSFLLSWSRLFFLFFLCCILL